MKVCLGQINTTPGDFAGNLAAIRQGIDTASQAECDLIVFPELTIPGYLSQDLLYHPEFIDRNLAVLDEIRAYTRQVAPSLHVVVGYVARNLQQGKPFLNMAAVISRGLTQNSYCLFMMCLMSYAILSQETRCLFCRSRILESVSRSVKIYGTTRALMAITTPIIRFNSIGKPG